MFNNDKLTEQLEKQQRTLEETIVLLRALLEQNEKQNKAWKILADRVLQLDDPQKAAFGVVRR
jgi:hypothetical protein